MVTVPGWGVVPTYIIYHPFISPPHGSLMHLVGSLISKGGQFTMDPKVIADCMMQKSHKKTKNMFQLLTFKKKVTFTNQFLLLLVDSKVILKESRFTGLFSRTTTFMLSVLSSYHFHVFTSSQFDGYIHPWSRNSGCGNAAAWRLKYWC